MVQSCKVLGTVMCSLLSDNRNKHELSKLSAQSSESLFQSSILHRESISWILPDIYISLRGSKGMAIKIKIDIKNILAFLFNSFSFWLWSSKMVCEWYRQQKPKPYSPGHRLHFFSVIRSFPDWGTYHKIIDLLCGNSLINKLSLSVNTMWE